MIIWCLLLLRSCVCLDVFLFKQKTAYEMRISDWSSDVCSSDLVDRPEHPDVVTAENPEKLQGWNPFYKRALKPALEEVNRLAAFTVTIEPKTGYCGRRVEKVHFIVKPKSGDK